MVAVRIELVKDADACLRQLKGLTTLQELQVDQNGASDAGLNLDIGIRLPFEPEKRDFVHDADGDGPASQAS